MTGQRGHGDDDVVSDLHVMSEVAVGKNVGVRTNHGGLAVAGSAMDGDALADGIVIADFGTGDASAPFEVLRLESDAGKGVDLVACPKAGVSVNYDARSRLFGE